MRHSGWSLSTSHSTGKPKALLILPKKALRTKAFGNFVEDLRLSELLTYYWSLFPFQIQPAVCSGVSIISCCCGTQLPRSISLLLAITQTHREPAEQEGISSSLVGFEGHQLECFLNQLEDEDVNDKSQDRLDKSYLHENRRFCRFP